MEVNGNRKIAYQLDSTKKNEANFASPDPSKIPRGNFAIHAFAHCFDVDTLSSKKIIEKYPKIEGRSPSHLRIFLLRKKREFLLLVCCFIS